MTEPIAYNTSQDKVQSGFDLGTKEKTASSSRHVLDAKEIARNDLLEDYVDREGHRGASEDLATGVSSTGLSAIKDKTKVHQFLGNEEEKGAVPVSRKDNDNADQDSPVEPAYLEEYSKAMLLETKGVESEKAREEEEEAKVEETVQRPRFPSGVEDTLDPWKAEKVTAEKENPGVRLQDGNRNPQKREVLDGSDDDVIGGLGRRVDNKVGWPHDQEGGVAEREGDGAGLLGRAYLGLEGSKEEGEKWRVRAGMEVNELWDDMNEEEEEGGFGGKRVLQKDGDGGRRGGEDGSRHHLAGGDVTGGRDVYFDDYDYGETGRGKGGEMNGGR